MTNVKAKTLDGKRTSVHDMNTGSYGEISEQKGVFSRILKTCKNINLFMAGMYTGVGCGGTPHTHHNYSVVESVDEKAKNNPDSKSS